MESLKLILLIFSMTLVACGKNLKYKESNVPVQNVTGQSLSGYYTNLNGSEVDLKSLDNITHVLIFAQDTCHVCSEEATKLAAYVKDNGLPNVFQLRHLLVSSALEDALDWTDSHEITWPVGIANADLFRNYCPALQVPCIVVFKPNLGITFQHTGPVPVNDLIKETNGWAK